MEYVEFTLQNGMVGKVDKKDWPVVSKLKWRAICNSKKASANWYIRGNTKPIEGVFMHRLLLKAPKGSYVDHINGDGLDNRRSNIRLTNALGNSRNSKPKNGRKYKGVCKPSRGGEGFQIFLKGKYHGRRKSEHVAAIEHDCLALQAYGDFAYLNFPKDLVEEFIKLKNVAKGDK